MILRLRGFDTVAAQRRAQFSWMTKFDHSFQLCFFLLPFQDRADTSPASLPQTLFLSVQNCFKMMPNLSICSGLDITEFYANHIFHDG